MSATAAPPFEATFDSTVREWQWALDAAARALDADRCVLPPRAITSAQRSLAAERKDVQTLLRRVAGAHRQAVAPWLSPIAVTAGTLGLPSTTEACIFDLDGVLTDSDALHAAAWAGALDPFLLSAAAEAGWQFVPFDRAADYTAYFDGRPRVEGLRLFLAGRGLHLSDDAIDGIAARKGELIERRLLAHGVAAHRGARRYLEAAGFARLPRAVVSASLTAEPMLASAGLSHLVDAHVDANRMRARRLHSRPAVDILVEICGELNVEPGRAVSLTHSGAGVVAAHTLGMPVLGFGVGASAQSLRDYGAPTVATSLDALLDPRLREP